MALVYLSEDLGVEVSASPDAVLPTDGVDVSASPDAVLPSVFTVSALIAVVVVLRASNAVNSNIKGIGHLLILMNLLEHEQTDHTF